MQELEIPRSSLVVSTKIFWGGKGVNDRGLSRKVGPAVPRVQGAKRTLLGKCIRCVIVWRSESNCAAH